MVMDTQRQPHFSPDTRCYHFASQNVFLSDTQPSHFGMAGPDRIYLIYETMGKMEIYKFISQEDRQVRRQEREYHGDSSEAEPDLSAGDEKESFVLERCIKLQNTSILQVMYCYLAPEYFVFLSVDSLTHLRTVRAYTNFTSLSEKASVVFRQAAELARALDSPENSNHNVPLYLEPLDDALHLIDFKHADLGTLANYLSCCQVSGNFLLSLANGTTLMYQVKHLILPAKPQSSPIDFLLLKSISVLDGWIPEVVKLSLNYVALMSQTHFSLLKIVFQDPDEYKDGHHLLEVRHDPKYRVSEEIHLVYNRLFDEPISQESMFTAHENVYRNSHADTVWGPVKGPVSCKFAVYEHEVDGQTAQQSPYTLLFCRQFKIPKRKRTGKSHPNLETRICPIDLQTIQGKETLCAEQEQAAIDSPDLKVYLFGCELLPLRNREGNIFAHTLYILWMNRIDVYVIDLRRDKLQLVPISRLDLTSPPLCDDALNGGTHPFAPNTMNIRHFSANPQEDLLHILINDTVETYSTELFPFLVSEEPETLCVSRPIVDMYQLSRSLFLNLISSLSSPEFLFLLSGEESGRHTVYILGRPTSSDHMQADILSGLEEIRCNSENDEKSNHSFHILYCRLLASIKFACLYPMRSISPGECSSEFSPTRMQCLENLYKKIKGEIEAIIEERPTCHQPFCPFAVTTTAKVDS